MLYISARAFGPTAKEGSLAFWCNYRRTIPDKGEASGGRRPKTQMARAGVFWLAEEFPWENELTVSKSLYFFKQNEIFKISFHLSFNMFLKMSQKK